MVEIDPQFLGELRENGYSSFLISDSGKFAGTRKMFTEAPSPIFHVHSWKYETTLRLLRKLSSMVRPEEAERVNVQFEHPDLKEYIPAATTTTMRSGMQMIKPGQFAPEHRHTARSFRLVLEGPEDGAYTNAAGYDLPLRKGDIILNPADVWHSHRNESEKEVIWFNGMDVIMAYWLGGIFYSDSKRTRIEPRIPADVNINNWGKLGVNYFGKNPNAEGILYYPREYTIEAVIEASVQNPENCETVRKLLDPSTSGSLYPTLEVKFWHLPGLTESSIYKRTENIVFLVYSGSGVFSSPSGNFQLGKYDVIAVPSWTEYHWVNRNSEPLILLSYSDAPIFRASGWYREEK